MKKLFKVFLIIALVLFSIVKAVNASKKQLEKMEASARKSLNKNAIAQKKEVLAQAKAEGKSFKTAWKEHQAKKQQEAEEEEKKKAEAEAEAKAKAEQDKEKMLEKLSVTDKLLYEINERLKAIEQK